MRYIALAIILTSLPVFISLLQQHPHRRSWALVAIGALVFFGNNLRIEASIISWPLWNGTVRGFEVSVVDTLAIALLITRGRRPGGLPFWSVIAFYGVALVLSVFQSTVPMASLFPIWQFGRLALLVVAIAGECHRDDLRKGLLAGFALGLMLQAGFVIDQKLHGVVQATGTMAHQNALGMMTELALMPLLASLMTGDRRKIVFAGILAGMIIIAGGGSRGAVSIAGGGVVLLMLLSLARGVTPIKLRIVGLGMLAIALAAPFAVATLSERFGKKSVTEQDAERPAFRRAATAMSDDYPLGVGANMYVPTANTKGYSARAGVIWNTGSRSAPVHNAYLLTRAETGWLGEFAFIALLVVPILRGLHLAFTRRRGTIGEVALGSAIALAVNVVHNNFEFAALLYNVFVLVMLNIAMIAAQIRASRGVGAPRAAPPRPQNVPVAATA